MPNQPLVTERSGLKIHTATATGTSPQFIVGTSEPMTSTALIVAANRTAITVLTVSLLISLDNGVSFQKMANFSNINMVSQDTLTLTPVFTSGIYQLKVETFTGTSVDFWATLG